MDFDRETIKSMLREQSFWADVPEPDLDALAAVSTVRDFAAGSTIFREGGDNHFLYVLQHGHVGLDMNVAGRGRVRILSLGPGEMLAWSALLGDGQMTATATALEETQVISAAGQHLVELCNASHEFGYQLMTRVADVLAKRLVATRLQLLDLFSPSAMSGSTDGS
jgi:CRP-like cAMP-binding protein